MNFFSEVNYSKNENYRKANAMSLDVCNTAIKKLLGCEGNMAATSVTPLISRVDSGDLAGKADVPLIPY